MQFVKALNTVSSQIWALVAMLMGAGFIIHGDRETGTNLLMGAFALFRSTSEDKKDSPNSDIKVS